MEKYFITGSSYFIDKNIKLFTPKDDNLDLEIFFGDELNKEDFLSYINSVDLFGSPKAAIIRNAGRIKDIEHLAEIMSKCSETTLIITAPVKDKIDQSLVKIFKNKNFKVFVEEQKKAKATIYDVIDIFKEKNIKLSQEQAEIMLSKCLNNLSMVLHESEKLETYILGKKEKISVSTLLDQLSGEKEETIFALTDAFGMRDIKTALKVYSTMDNSYDSNFKIFFALSKRIMQLYLLNIDEDYLKQVHPFQLSKIKEQKKKWKIKEIVKAIDIISELDKDIKIGLKSIDNAVLSAITSADKL